MTMLRCLWALQRGSATCRPDLSLLSTLCCSLLILDKGPGEAAVQTRVHVELLHIPCRQCAAVGIGAAPYKSMPQSQSWPQGRCPPPRCSTARVASCRQAASAWDWRQNSAWS